VIRIFGYQGAEKGDEGFFVPLYKNNAKNQKSSRKIFDFGKIFFRATRMVVFCYMVFQKNTLNMDDSYDYDKFMSILPEL